MIIYNEHQEVSCALHALEGFTICCWAWWMTGGRPLCWSCLNCRGASFDVRSPCRSYGDSTSAQRTAPLVLVLQVSSSSASCTSRIIIMARCMITSTHWIKEWCNEQIRIAVGLLGADKYNYNPFTFWRSFNNINSPRLLAPCPLR